MHIWSERNWHYSRHFRITIAMVGSVWIFLVKDGKEVKTDDLTDDQKLKIMSLSGVKQYPMRVKCATLSWHTLVSAMANKKEDVNTEIAD